MADFQIDEERCDGCGNCVAACPVEVLTVHEGKARPNQPDVCMLCMYCEVECPKEAIKVTD